MTEEYKQKELEFMARTDSLCEDTQIHLCDCSKCPTHDLCKWLCDNDPNLKQEVTT